MNHKKLQILVSSFLDCEVNESEKALVLSHLEVCSECREFIEHAKRLKEEISVLGEVKLANSFTARVVSSVERRDDQAIEWLGIEPSARNTFILLASFVLIIFFLTTLNNNTALATNDQLLKSITKDSMTTRVLLQPDNFSKSDLLYAVMTK